MQLDFAIPSFNPSLSGSRKGQTSTPQPSALEQFEQPKYNFTKKLFEAGDIEMYGDERGQGRYGKFEGKEEFWGPLYGEQCAVYKGLSGKYGILEESIRLHRQALSLCNTEHIENEQRTAQITTRCKALHQKSKQNQQKLSLISQKCQQTKQTSQQIRSKTHKEESIIVQQDKHMADLQLRMARMQDQMRGIERELAQAVEKEREYYQVVGENQGLRERLARIKKEAGFAKIKIDRDWSQEENMLRKMKELEKIVRNKEKNNRELGKRLIQVKKENPDALTMAQQQKSTQKTSKTREIVKNIKDMQEQYGRLQQQIYEIGQKIELTNEKMQQKIKNIEIIKMKQKSKASEEAELEESRKGNQIYASSHYEAKIEESRRRVPPVPGKKPAGYRVIESEQNEHYVFPRTTLRHQTNTNDKNGSKSLEKSENLGSRNIEYEDRPSQELTMQKSQESQREEGYSNENENEDKILEIDENLKKLVAKFQKYKSNSLFKH